MSLMRFLVVGSSLRGIKDRPSPYKMTQQHLLPKFGSGKEADGKAAGSLLIATDDDESDESTTVATTVTAEGCDGEDSETEGTPGLHVARSEAEEMKANLPEANLKIDTASERVGSSLSAAEPAPVSKAPVDVVREPLPDGRDSDASHPSPLQSEPRPSGSG